VSNVPPPPPPPGFGEQPPPYGAPAPGHGQPYGAPGYGYGYAAPNQREHPSGTTVLLLGILGLVLCQVLSPIAWVMGGRARKEMASQPGVVWTNSGNITAGWICGIIGTVLVALGVVLVLIVIAAAVSTA
jgi:hypothetical protein